MVESNERRLRGTIALALAVVLCTAIWAALGTGVAAGRDNDLSNQMALDWNTLAVNAVRSATTMDGVPPGSPARTLYQVEGLIYMSYVQAAVYDAVIKIEHRYRLYHDFSAGAGNASAEAAVVQAAYDTLTYYLGDRSGTLAAAYQSSLASLPQDQQTQRGLAVGAAAAKDIEQLRSGDGRDAATGVYGTPGPVVAGVWQVVPPFTTAQTPWVAFMRSFMLKNAAQFRLPPSPALTSATYATDLNETEAYGASNSTVRTADETAIAYFWNANVINQDNQLYRDLAVERNLDLVDTVHLMAMGDLTVTDAGIACFDSKYTYLRWRPYTAIRNADLDGNPATTANPTWTPLLSTPNHPEYPAAHGCLTSALSDVLANALGTDDIDVTIWGATNGGTALATTRHFATVDDLRTEIVNARVWAGLHFRSSVEAGVTLGDDVASWVLDRNFQSQGAGSG